MSGPGTIYECQECETLTLRTDECPVCESEDLEPLTRGT